MKAENWFQLRVVGVTGKSPVFGPGSFYARTRRVGPVNARATSLASPANQIEDLRIVAQRDHGTVVGGVSGGGIVSSIR